jgi:hypothetical protein
MNDGTWKRLSHKHCAERGACLWVAIHDCHAIGRVPRDLTGLTDGMVKGWVEELCESVGWRGHLSHGGRSEWCFTIHIPDQEPVHMYADTRAEAALSALLAAVKAHSERVA